MKQTKGSFLTPTLAAMAVFLSAGIFTPGATAASVTYSITFTSTQGPAADTGTFSYDAGAAPGGQFSAFLVSWNGISFDLTSSANSPDGACGASSAAAFALLSHSECAHPVTPYSWTPVSPYPEWFAGRGSANGFPDFFSFDNQSANQDLTTFGDVHYPSSGTSQRAQGTFTIADTSAPEPKSLVLLLAGATLLVAGKRRSRHADDPTLIRRS